MIESSILNVESVENKKEFNCPYLYYAKTSNMAINDIKQLYHLGTKIEKSLIKNIEKIKNTLPRDTPISWYPDYNLLTDEVKITFYIDNVHISFCKTFLKEVVDYQLYYTVYSYDKDKNIWLSYACEINDLVSSLDKKPFKENTMDDIYKIALEMYNRNNHNNHK